MQLNVVYIDDESELCELFTELFSSDRVNVRSFNDAKEGILACTNSKPDVVFLDYRMPNTNGDLVAQELKLDVPIYLISGEVQIATQYAFRKVLPKPYDQTAIQDILSTLLNKQ